MSHDEATVEQHSTEISEHTHILKKIHGSWMPDEGAHLDRQQRLWNQHIKRYNFLRRELFRHLNAAHQLHNVSNFPSSAPPLLR